MINLVLYAERPAFSSMGTLCPISSGAVSLLGRIVSNTRAPGEIWKIHTTWSNPTFISIALNISSLERNTLGWILIAILIAIKNLLRIPISYASRT